MTPELTLIVLAATVIALGYGFIYPRFAGNDFKRVSMQDVFATAVTLFIGFKLNWFWFTLLTYLIIEIPVCLLYAKKHNMKFP